jgi:hypothetical protein
LNGPEIGFLFAICDVLEVVLVNNIRRKVFDKKYIPTEGQVLSKSLHLANDFVVKPGPTAIGWLTR